MAQQSPPTFDVLLIVFLILAVLLGVWVWAPELLSTGCHALPGVLQRASGCR